MNSQPVLKSSFTEAVLDDRADNLIEAFDEALTVEPPSTVLPMQTNQPLPDNALVVADDRAETDTCQKGTDGCCVDHSRSTGIWVARCETW